MCVCLCVKYVVCFGYLLSEEETSGTGSDKLFFLSKKHVHVHKHVQYGGGGGCLDVCVHVFMHMHTCI